MNDFLPNWSLLKSPMNWFLVAFSIILLGLLFHFVFKGNDNG